MPFQRPDYLPPLKHAGTIQNKAHSLDLADLDPEQRAAATAPRGPVCILAGAGTGKTRTITHRINWMIDQGIASQQRILAVTFTSRAAGEMRDRLHKMGSPGVQTRTFHSAALRQLKYFWPQVAGDLPWQLLDNRFGMVARAARNVGANSAKDAVRDFLGEIEWAKASLVTPEYYPKAIEKAGRTAPVDPETVAMVYRAYETAKNTPDGMFLDFDDLLLHTAGAMENSLAVAEEFREQYQSFVVDEYQDVTPLQQRVLDAWLGERDNITVVGDANQTIYSFTGATPEYLLQFKKKYPQATLVRLERDYRSTPQVVHLANSVIGKATGRIAGTRLELIGQRPDGPAPIFTNYDDETQEAAMTARSIQRLIESGTRPAEIAILYRINAQSAAFEQALTDAKIPYQVRGGEGFYNRAEIRQAIGELMRVAKRPDLPQEAVGAELHRIVRAALAPLGLTAKEPDGAQARERWQSLNALAELSEELGTQMPGLNLSGLLMELRRRSEAKQPPQFDGVTLASLHAAKGLEWDAVFLVGLTDGNLPIQHALKKGDDSEAVEEERRLLYVGVTRAREHLELSWAAARQPGGRKTRNRSRFLDGIAPDESAAVTVTKQSNRRRGRCDLCDSDLETMAERIVGRCADCPSSADPELVAALQKWRLAESRAIQKPAFVVFSDAVLTAIAEAKPADEAALLQVPGIGPAKSEKYGAQILALVEEFIEGG